MDTRLRFTRNSVIVSTKRVDAKIFARPVQCLRIVDLHTTKIHERPYHQSDSHSSALLASTGAPLDPLLPTPAATNARTLLSDGRANEKRASKARRVHSARGREEKDRKENRES